MLSLKNIEEKPKNHEQKNTVNVIDSLPEVIL